MIVYCTFIVYLTNFYIKNKIDILRYLKMVKFIHIIAIFIFFVFIINIVYCGLCGSKHQVHHHKDDDSVESK